MMFNIENCDVTMENGYLRLIYHTDKLPVPMVLAVTKSYHDLNEKAMQLFDGDDWAESVVEWNLRKEDPIWHNLLADIYVSHNDMYKKTMAVNKKEPTKYIALEFTGEKNEQGHRMGRLDFEDLKKMDYDCLKLLAKDLDVSEYDTLGPNDLAYLDDRDEKDDDSCEAEEHPEWPHPIEEDIKPDSSQYEYVNGPAHYNGTECIENMRKLYGDDAIRWFCICNAYKYRFRDGSKPGVTAEQDKEKAHWYEDYAANMMGEQRYY